MYNSKLNIVNVKNSVNYIHSYFLTLINHYFQASAVNFHLRLKISYHCQFLEFLYKFNKAIIIINIVVLSNFYIYIFLLYTYNI